LDYDIFALAGKEIVGGAGGKVFRYTPATGYLTGRSQTQVFILLGAACSDATAGQWDTYKGLRAIREELNRASTEKQGTPNFADVLRAVRVGCAGKTVDGMAPDAWLAAQPVAYTEGTPGLYLHAFSSAGGYVFQPEAFQVAAFRRKETGISPEAKDEVQVTDGFVNVEVDGLTWPNGEPAVMEAMTLNLAEQEGGRPRSTRPLGTRIYGAYRIRAKGVLEGQEVTATPSYMAFPTRNVPWVTFPAGTSNYISSLVMILVNEDGSISGKPLPPIPGGRFLMNERGLAIWQPDNASVAKLPKSVTVNGKTYTLPLPQSHVVVVSNN
jgi:hypothetical protein